jgi:hypothetical protein
MTAKNPNRIRPRRPFVAARALEPEYVVEGDGIEWVEGIVGVDGIDGIDASPRPPSGLPQE